MLIESARDLEAMQKVDPWPIWDFVCLGCYGFVYVYIYIWYPPPGYPPVLV